MKRVRPILCASGALLLAFAALSDAQAPLASHGKDAAPPAPAPPAAGDGATAAGVTWTVPSSWTVGAGSSMRVATYQVPAAKDAEAGECAVFYFGRGQGGGVDANIQRWSGQFKEKPAPKTSRTTAAGVAVTRVDIAGTYLNPGGGMMQSRGEKPGYRLLGAIVEAPEGPVFFKMTGPGATVAAAETHFDGLLASLAKK